MNGIRGEVHEDKIRVLIVGESPLVRAGLEVAVADSERFEIVGSTNLAGSQAMFESLAADAVLMERATFSYWQADETNADIPVPPPNGALTPREIEVLRLLAEGASNKIIAFKLGVSDHTVKFHVASILSKLNAGTRTEAVTMGVRMGLIYL